MKPLILPLCATERSSRPARGAWIETAYLMEQSNTRSVAPRAGRVD